MQTMPQQEMQLEDSAANCEAIDDGAQQVNNKSDKTVDGCFGFS
jgi:hypothetical protein